MTVMVLQKGAKELIGNQRNYTLKNAAAVGSCHGILSQTGQDQILIL